MCELAPESVLSWRRTLLDFTSTCRHKWRGIKNNDKWAPHQGLLRVRHWFSSCCLCSHSSSTLGYVPLVAYWPLRSKQGQINSLLAADLFKTLKSKPGYPAHRAKLSLLGQSSLTRNFNTRGGHSTLRSLRSWCCKLRLFVLSLPFINVECQVMKQHVLFLVFAITPLGFKPPSSQSHRGQRQPLHHRVWFSRPRRAKRGEAIGSRCLSVWQSNTIENYFKRETYCF